MNIFSSGIFGLVARFMRLLVWGNAMFVTDVEYATTNEDALETLLTSVAPDFGSKGDGIINTNFLFAMLKEKNRFKLLSGGLEFWNALIGSENSNFGWRSHTAQVPVNLQDPNLRLRFPIQTFDGAMVINQKHKAMVKGRAMMRDWVMGQRDQAKSTIPNQFNSAFWKTTPGALEPSSIPSLITITPLVGTIGGQTRSTNVALQNGADTSGISDIGSEAGIAAMTKLIIEQTIGANDAVDLVIHDSANFSGLSGFLATLQRLRPNDKMAQLKIQTIQLGNTTIGFENLVTKGGANTITAGRMYGINSNHLKLKALRDGNFIWDPKGFRPIGNGLDRGLFFWFFGNLDTDLPAAHFVATGVATT